MPNLLASLGAQTAPEAPPALPGGRLSPVRSAILVVVDGLGAEQLRAHSAYARFLTQRKLRVISSVFPSTTAAALTTITTGVLPGAHGLVGYEVLDAGRDRLVNQLSGWDAHVRPEDWQRVPTGFETAAARGIESVAIGSARYAGSGFSGAVLRGARYVGAESIPERFERALAEARAGRRLVYVYVPELDQASHRSGGESPAWIEALEEVDGAMRRTVAALPADVGLALTADHGAVDVAEHQQVLFDRTPGLVDGIRHVGGEPRLRQFYLEPDLLAADRERLRAAWEAAEGHRAWVFTREEAVAAGLFGPVDAEVLPRIGDLLVAARKRVAYYDSRPSDQRSRAMIGQHGSMTEAELLVPWLTYGAYAAG